ncbi:MAG: D-cysteine desulfhydrase family protein [Planctomycetia bacterium]
MSTPIAAAGFLPPAHLPLARVPTPLEPLPRAGAGLGLPLWVKRDDLTGTELTGNKVRKLGFLCAEALERGADTLITCGAVTSNHARATALVAARLGLRCQLLLRGTGAEPPDGNLLLDLLAGAAIEYVTPEGWRERDVRMGAMAERLRAQGRRPYVIPEGGSNALGSLGYALAVRELLEQAADLGVEVGTLVHATGSGGTTAGLALGCAAWGRPDIDVVGVAVCDDAATFDRRVAGILDQAVGLWYAGPDLRAACRWRIVDGHQGQGYARTTPAELREQALLARSEGLVLDPVYTGKAWLGLQAEARAGRLRRDAATVFVHTGGLLGLFAFAREVREALGGAGA